MALLPPEESDPPLRLHVWCEAPPGAPLFSFALTVDASGVLVALSLNPRLERRIDLAAPGHIAAVGKPHPDAVRAAEEILDYLRGKRRRFTLSWRLPEGVSAFRRAVLEVVMAIPFGETRSYAEVASRAGHPAAARAVGGTMATNPLPLVIPCHRVLAAGGRLGGFSGGLHTKRALLRHEGHPEPL